MKGNKKEGGRGEQQFRLDGADPEEKEGRDGTGAGGRA